MYQLFIYTNIGVVLSTKSFLWLVFINGVGEYGSCDEADSYQLKHEHPIPTDGKVPYYQALIEAYHLT